MLFDWFVLLPGEAASKWPPEGTKRLRDLFVPFGGSLNLTGHAFDKLNFFRNVRTAIVAKDFVKPDRRLTIHIRVLPRIPRQIRLGLTLDQSPIDHADMMNPADHQTTEEEAAIATSHVFCADDWPVVPLEPNDPLLKLCRRIVVMKRDDVCEVDL